MVAQHGVMKIIFAHAARYVKYNNNTLHYCIMHFIKEFLRKKMMV